MRSGRVVPGIKNNAPVSFLGRLNAILKSVEHRILQSCKEKTENTENEQILTRDEYLKIMEEARKRFDKYCKKRPEPKYQFEEDIDWWIAEVGFEMGMKVPK